MLRNSINSLRDLETEFTGQTREMVRKQYIPLQDGNALFHAGFPSAPITHVIVEGSIILYPESHW